MDPTRGTQIDLAERRIAWLEARQRVLAQNIANADTPGYEPRDLAPFAALLARRIPRIGLARTNSGHLSPTGDAADGRVQRDRGAAERSRNGNGVSLDEQALKIADTDMAHALATGLHKRWLGMFRAALGRS